MRTRLGDMRWFAFVSHANRHYKAAYVSMFQKRVLHCVGPLDGGPCAHSFVVDLAVPDAKEKLKCLHLDHEVPVHVTCAWWMARLPDTPRSWDDGLDGAAGALCHALFGVEDDAVHGARCVRFRCGPRHTSSGASVPFAQHTYCHTS